MKKEKLVRIWVNPEFKNVVKANASIEGIRIVDYTKRLTDELNKYYGEKKEGKKNAYWFKF